MVKGTNAKFITISPEEHDYLTGVISHFPHVIAASLVHQAEKTSQEQNLVTRLAAGGFRDITRIASSSPTMWRDILLHNKEVLLQLLNEWQQEMKEVVIYWKSRMERKSINFFQKQNIFVMNCRKKKKGNPFLLRSVCRSARLSRGYFRSYRIFG